MRIGDIERVGEREIPMPNMCTAIVAGNMVGRASTCRRWQSRYMEILPLSRGSS
jgi:hypothetical protein